MFKNMTPKEKSEAKWGLLFVAPTIIGLAILNFYPKRIHYSHGNEKAPTLNLTN